MKTRKATVALIRVYLSSGAKEANDGALGSALGGGNCLGIGIQSHANRGMPQQFLHDFEIRPGFSQQCRIGMAKSMPPNSLSNSHAMSGRTYPLAHDLLAPVGLSSANPWTGEDPIVWATVRRLPTPGAQSFCQHGIKRNRLLRGLSFTSDYHLHHNGSRDANLLCGEIDVLPFQCEQLAYPKSSAHGDQEEDSFSTGKSA